MKKEYIEPRSRVLVLKSRGLLLASPGIYGSLSPSGGGVSEDILGYGGIDENGELDPE
jgi:hypothetical protein